MASSSSSSLVKSFLSSVESLWRNEDEDPMTVLAVPGLMTLLDTALFQSVQSELTATVATAHILLNAWLEVQEQCQVILRLPSSDTDVSQFARLCHEAAKDAIDKITSDKLALTANLSSTSGGSNTASVSSFTDCDWESTTLYCIDYVWADEVAYFSQRLLSRHIYKQSVYIQQTSSTSSNSSRQVTGATASIPLDNQKEVSRQLSILSQLLETDLPVRLVQFRASMEAEAVVSKRLYLIKCEYRAPFRAFLEAHASVLKAPELNLVLEYLNASGAQKKALADKAKRQLKELLEQDDIVQALAIEQECDKYANLMARSLACFGDLQRWVEQRKCTLRDPAGEKTLADLKRLAMQSSSILPLLLELQGVLRSAAIATTVDDDEPLSGPLSNLSRIMRWRKPPRDSESQMLQRLERFVADLETLVQASEGKRALFVTSTSANSHNVTNLDVPQSIVQRLREFDGELFSCYYQDWYGLVKLQHEIVRRNNNFSSLAQDLRRAEMSLSLAAAPAQSIQVIKERVEMISNDRDKRLKVLQDMIREVCLREMNLHVEVKAPEPTQSLSLQPTSALGVFGMPMQLAKETTKWSS